MNKPHTKGEETSQESDRCELAGWCANCDGRITGKTWLGNSGVTWAGTTPKYCSSQCRTDSEEGPEWVRQLVRK